MKFSWSSHSLILFRNMCNERQQIQRALHVQTTLFTKSQAWKRHGSKMPVAQLQRTPPLFIILLEIWEQFFTHNYLWSLSFLLYIGFEYQSSESTRKLGFSEGIPWVSSEKSVVTSRSKQGGGMKTTFYRLNRCVDQSTCFVGRADQRYRT